MFSAVVSVIRHQNTPLEEVRPVHPNFLICSSSLSIASPSVPSSVHHLCSLQKAIQPQLSQIDAPWIGHPVCDSQYTFHYLDSLGY